MENIKLPIAVVLAAAIIGGFYYASQIKVERISKNDVVSAETTHVPPSDQPASQIKTSPELTQNKTLVVSQSKTSPNIATPLSPERQVYGVSINKVSEASGILTSASTSFQKGLKDILDKNYQSGFLEFDTAIDEYNKGVLIISSININSPDLPFRDDFVKIINLYKDLSRAESSKVLLYKNFYSLMEVGAASLSDLEQFQDLDLKSRALSKAMSADFFSMYLQITKNAINEFN